MQEEQRDDVPKIHLESMKEWKRVKSNVTVAMSEILSRSTAIGESEAIWGHLTRVSLENFLGVRLLIR